MKRRVTFSPQARDQAREVGRWWRENRPSARLLFAAEVRQALLLIAGAPGIGVLYPHPQIGGVRRLLLSGTRCHLYYVHEESTDAIEIVAVWGAIRGSGPIVRR